jgi:ABC-type glycerol-3-phosphate transport system substrate-binding protein
MTPSLHLVSARVMRAILAVGLAIGGITLAACSSSSSSSGTTTTSGTDPDVLQVIAAAKAQAATHGLSAGDISVTAKVSPANDSWMMFKVDAKSNGSANMFQPYYGYAHQTQTWSVVATGTADVGCPTTGSATSLNSSQPSVPLSVIQSFGMSCPTTSS